MDIVVGAEGDRGHPAELQSLLLSGDNVEKRRRDRRQRFPDDDPQLNRQGVRKEKNHTSNQLKIIVIIWHYFIHIKYILQLERQIFLKIFLTSKSQAKKLILVDRLLLSLRLLLSSSLIPEKERFFEKCVQISPDRAALKVFLNRKMAQ